MLQVKNLKVRVEDREILKGINLTVNKGEVHAIMGPNGSGKSTLARALSGHPGYEVTEGQVLYNGQDLLDMDPDERARDGVFMAFQYPVEIPGVNNAYFLKAALNAKRKQQGLDELDAMDFMKLVKEKLKILHVDDSMLQRSVNEGFSGGEKKRNEIFHMAVLEPTLARARRNRFGPRHRRAARRLRRRQRDAQPRARVHRRHPLPAAAQLHRAGLRARAERRQHRPVGRPRAGARARRKGLRGPDRGGSETVMETLVQAPAWVKERRERRREAICGGRLPDDAAGRLALHEHGADRGREVSRSRRDRSRRRRRSIARR